MTTIFHSGLSKDLSLILNDADDFNVIIQVGENQNTKEFYAHSVILRARSPYFKCAFSSNWISKKNNMIIFNKPNVTPTVFDIILKYIYTDPEPFISSKMFPSLDKNILFGLLKRDDLQVEEEIVAWDCLIKWGIEQTPGLGNKNSDRTKWNNENFEALKKTLNQFIPLIRFVGISSGSFFDKVQPYKAIIPHYIYEELEEFYCKKALSRTTILLPRRRQSRSLMSAIIKFRLANAISKWTDKNDLVTHSNDNKCKFNLIYSMSRDGSNGRTFYNKCNGQGPFVVLIRVQSNKIYGGYNPIGCTGGNKWLSSTESFIFSFENNQNIYNMKFGRVINSAYSVYDSSNYFFSFGDILYINGRNLNIGYNNGHYENIFGEKKILNIEEIEVFSVVKE
ncbi:hypothetical protein GLOIN_2v1842978 [Rhizophagus irregularis DAOM 181602=DAOM 197198]|nr:hypothetical protein GLOIN_2v1842978 [Rhizophagus irregularis DAOM 181602=DAOM 197198]